MADFQSLKNARKQRAGHLSFVKNGAAGDAGALDSKQEVNTQEDMEVDSSEPATEESRSSVSEAENSSTSQGANIEGLYKALPQTLEIRTTPEAGRGLYSTASYKPGMFSMPS